jgi:F-type H+-transporting ATPase subunit b
VVEFDATILIQAINFLVLLAILNQIFFKPILRIQSERQEAVDGARKSAESRMQELKSMREGYHQKLDAARQEAFELVSSQVAAATQAREAELRNVNAEMEARMNEAKEELAGQEAGLRSSLEKEVNPLAELILAQLLGSSEPESKQEVSVG